MRTPRERSELGKKGNKKSTEVKRQRKTFKKAVEWLANSDIKLKEGNIYDLFKKSGIDISNLDTTQLATIGLWYGAVQGNASNYKTLMEANNEIDSTVGETPSVTVNIVDNSHLEKALYDEED
jgi:hypothetical protein